MTSIFALADAGDTTGVISLLKDGKIDGRDSDGRTALHHAAVAGHASLVEALVQRGATRETVDDGGWSPLHSAAAAGRAECVTALITADATNLKAGAGSSGSTALILAASKGHARIVRTLLEARANALAVDGSGGTSLHRAAAKGHVAVLEALLTLRHDLVDRRDREGHTAFHLACIHEQPDACIALAEGGAELETTNAEGEAAASLLKPSLRSQLGLLGPEEAAEDHTDWLAEHYPVPQHKVAAPGSSGLYL